MILKALKNFSLSISAVEMVTKTISNDNGSDDENDEESKIDGMKTEDFYEKNLRFEQVDDEEETDFSLNNYSSGNGNVLIRITK